MEELSAIKFTETRSRFFAHVYKIDTIGESDQILKEHRKKYKKANHHCWAMTQFTDAQGKLVEYSKDDGEVGHPGKALMELMKKKELDSHMLMVSRVYGGVKLGVGGVTRAFRSAGDAALDMI